MSVFMLPSVTCDASKRSRAETARGGDYTACSRCSELLQKSYSPFLLPKTTAAVDPTGSHHQQWLVDREINQDMPTLTQRPLVFLRSLDCANASSLSDTEFGQKWTYHNLSIFLMDLKHVRTIKAGSIQNCFGRKITLRTRTCCSSYTLLQWWLSDSNEITRGFSRPFGPEDLAMVTGKQCQGNQLVHKQIINQSPAGRKLHAPPLCGGTEEAQGKDSFWIRCWR